MSKITKTFCFNKQNRFKQHVSVTQGEQQSKTGLELDCLNYNQDQVEQQAIEDEKNNKIHANNLTIDQKKRNENQQIMNEQDQNQNKEKETYQDTLNDNSNRSNNDKKKVNLHINTLPNSKHYNNVKISINNVIKNSRQVTNRMSTDLFVSNARPNYQSPQFNRNQSFKNNYPNQSPQSLNNYKIKKNIESLPLNRSTVTDKSIKIANNFNLKLHPSKSIPDAHSHSNPPINANFGTHSNWNTSSSNPRKTKNYFFVSQEDANFIPIDQKRVSRYNTKSNKNNSSQPKLNKQELKTQKWDKCLEHYMKARTKMQSHIRVVKNVNYQFDKLQLDKSHEIIKRRKILQLKNLSSREKSLQKQKMYKLQFVSNLIDAQNKSNEKESINAMNRRSIAKNQMIRTISNNGNVHRCDALLVNFVSTYFRRKFFKKTRKIPWIKRTKTDGSDLAEMVGLQGRTINEQILNQLYAGGQIQAQI